MQSKRKCENFIENNIKGYDVSRHFYKGYLVAITIKGKSRGKDVYIYDEYYFDDMKDDDKTCVLGMNILEEQIDSKSNDMKEMILYFLEKGGLKEYFYYNFGEGKCVERIPKVKNLEEWEEKQLIPILENFELFGFGSSNANLRQCNYLVKNNKALEFITDIIETYGYIKFGDYLELGKVEFTEEEFKELEEIW